MYRLGIDIGSTYTKYCLLEENDGNMRLFSEKTPIHQKECFEKILCKLKNEYDIRTISSCGYGKKNVFSMKTISEIVALAEGINYANPELRTVLDIGGQDTKVVSQKSGKVSEFFLNDRCAAGSGMFLYNTLNLLQIRFEDIDLTNVYEPVVRISSICAVFAQTEIVQMIANNVESEQIIIAVLWSIFKQAKAVLNKVNDKCICLSGGLAKIKGISTFASSVLDRDIMILPESNYLAAIGSSCVN